MGRRHCNCKADENLRQLKRFMNRGKDEPRDTFKDKVLKHLLRVTGNICALLFLPLAVPYVLITVKRNEKKGIGRVFKFNTNRWKPIIQKELSYYK